MAGGGDTPEGHSPVRLRRAGSPGQAAPEPLETRSPYGPPSGQQLPEETGDNWGGGERMV